VGVRLLLLTSAALVLVPASVGQARSEKKMDVKVVSVLSGASQSRDTIRMSDKLYNLVPQFGKPKGALVGSDSGTVKRTGTLSASFRGVARLPGGTLTVKGQVIAGEPISDVAVSGGTGRFAGARGIVVIRELSGRARAANIFHLTLP
jgi:hypothetical protein